MIKNEKYEKFPYLEDLRDKIAAISPISKDWSSYDVEKKYTEDFYDSNYFPNIERTEGAFNSYKEYPLPDSVTELSVIDRSTLEFFRDGFYPQRYSYADRAYFAYKRTSRDQKADLRLTADLMNGWNAPKAKYMDYASHRKPNNSSPNSKLYYLSFLKVIYTIGNMCITGGSFSPGPGAPYDLWDSKLNIYINLLKKGSEDLKSLKEKSVDIPNLSKLTNEDCWLRMMSVLGDTDIITSLFCQDYVVMDANRVNYETRHIWDDPVQSYYNEGFEYLDKESFKLRSDTSIQAIEKREKLSPFDAEEVYWRSFFSNATKLITQRGYRIHKRFTGKWNEAHAKEVRAAFNAVGLPEDDDINPDENGLRYSIIGEWEE